MGRVETGKYADRRLDWYSVSQGIASGVNRAIQPGGLSPKLDSKLHCSPIKRSREATSIKIVFSRIICQFIPIDIDAKSVSGPIVSGIWGLGTVSGPEMYGNL